MRHLGRNLSEVKEQVIWVRGEEHSRERKWQVQVSKEGSCLVCLRRLVWPKGSERRREWKECDQGGNKL